jgi:hypothetical protein
VEEAIAINKPIKYAVFRPRDWAVGDWKYEPNRLDRPEYTARINDPTKHI